jgi:cytochrome c-type biogenesis protein CcmF
MSPLLENPGMVIHPPVLFLGYAAYTIPFALALASLLGNEEAGTWVAASRRWGLMAWMAMSAGILIGGWWSYVELGWGGYWAWDPVENASLVPWLLGTALLHSCLLEERRGLHRAWNVWLATAAFVTCLFATLVTRGGIIVSDLHGFAETIQPVAYPLIAGIAASLVATLAAARLRRRKLSDDHEVEVLLSREGGFFLTNLLFSGAAALVLLGTVFPSLSRAWQGVVISLGSSFYERAVGPLLLATVALMGICPTLVWQGSGRHLLRRLAGHPPPRSSHGRCPRLVVGSKGHSSSPVVRHMLLRICIIPWDHRARRVR